jgi:DNA-binding transcriptional LysR family regulator
VAKLHDGLEQLKMLSANLRRLPEGRLHIGCLPSLGLSIMPAATNGFRRSYPAVTCELETDHIDALVTALRARRLDFAVTLLPGEHPGLRMEMLGEVELVYFGPKPGPDIALADIDGLDLVGISPSDKIGALIATSLDAAGRRSTPSIEVQTYFLACAIAVAGNGATIVDELTARSMLSEGFHIRRTLPRLSVELGFLTHETHISRGFYADFIRALKTALHTDY